MFECVACVCNLQHIAVRELLLFLCAPSAVCGAVCLHVLALEVAYRKYCCWLLSPRSSQGSSEKDDYATCPVQWGLSNIVSFGFYNSQIVEVLLMIICVINFRKPIRARNPEPYRISVETLLSWHVGRGLGIWCMCCARAICRASCAVHLHMACVPMPMIWDNAQRRVRSIRATGADDGAKVTVDREAPEQGIAAVCISLYYECDTFTSSGWTF